MAETMRIKADVNTRELREDLEAAKLGLGKELDLALVDIAGPVAIRAADLAPYDPEHRDDRKDGLPHLRDTIMPRIGAGIASIVSDVRGPVLEWGGHIEPRGVRIDIKQHKMAHRAFDEKAADLERNLDARLGVLFRLHGLA